MGNEESGMGSSNTTNAHCCTSLRDAVSFSCPDHPDPFQCPDALVTYSPSLCEYGLIVHDGGCSSVSILFCPWCGKQLPRSRRDQWFEELAKLGYDDPLSEDIPAAFRSDAWWRDEGRLGH